MHARRWSALVLTSIVALAGSGAVVGVQAKGPMSAYAPHIDPANFQTAIDNPYFPLVPGTKLTFVEKEGGISRDNVVEVTHDTRTIMGVPCVVVHDQLFVKGKLFEDTFDWYAQDKQGNVWYFGEDTREYLPGGKVNTGGSWEGGVGGAQPGVMMPGKVATGSPYRQEFLAGEAEDMGQIAALGEKVTVPYGSFADCVRIKEWSMIESGTAKKWYARGVGFVRSEGPGRELAMLTSVTKP